MRDEPDPDPNDTDAVRDWAQSVCDDVKRLRPLSGSTEAALHGHLNVALGHLLAALAEVDRLRADSVWLRENGGHTEGCVPFMDGGCRCGRSDRFPDTKELTDG